MKELGYTNEQGIWSSPPVAVAYLASVADVMRAFLVKRADELFCCVEGSPEERELEAIADALEAYEAQRWPLGKVPGGKASGAIAILCYFCKRLPTRCGRAEKHARARTPKSSVPLRNRARSRLKQPGVLPSQEALRGVRRSRPLSNFIYFR